MDNIPQTQSSKSSRHRLVSPLAVTITATFLLTLAAIFLLAQRGDDSWIGVLVVFLPAFGIAYVAVSIFNVISFGNSDTYSSKRLVVALLVATVALGCASAFLGVELMSLHGPDALAGIFIAPLFGGLLYGLVGIWGLTAGNLILEAGKSKSIAYAGAVLTICVVTLGLSLVGGIYSPGEDTQISGGWNDYDNHELRVSFSVPAALPEPEIRQLSTRTVIDFGDPLSVTVGNYYNQASGRMMDIEDIAPSGGAKYTTSSDYSAIAFPETVYIAGPGETVAVIEAEKEKLDAKRVAEYFYFR